MEIEERVRYYMGKWYDTPITIYNTKQYMLQDIYNDTILLLDIHTIKRTPIFAQYSKYLIDIQGTFEDKAFLYTKGDVIHKGKKLPILCKVTDLGHSHIIVKLNHIRHWSLVRSVRANDIEYTSKKNSIVWRGSTTGITTRFRFDLVNKYKTHPVFDIGFTTVCQRAAVDASSIKPKLSLRDQLQYKFILSIEGNDVSSGLKWQLYSNSVVIMAKPTCVSWAMEDKLIPWVHYLPVKEDFSNLEEVFQWGLVHESKCKAITVAAQKFIEQFLDEEKELEIHRRIIARYAKNVTICDAEEPEKKGSSYCSRFAPPSFSP